MTSNVPLPLNLLLHHNAPLSAAQNGFFRLTLLRAEHQRLSNSGRQEKRSRQTQQHCARRNTHSSDGNPAFIGADVAVLLSAARSAFFQQTLFARFDNKNHLWLTQHEFIHAGRGSLNVPCLFVCARHLLSRNAQRAWTPSTSQKHVRKLSKVVNKFRTKNFWWPLLGLKVIRLALF